MVFCQGIYVIYDIHQCVYAVRFPIRPAVGANLRVRPHPRYEDRHIGLPLHDDRNIEGYRGFGE